VTTVTQQKLLRQATALHYLSLVVAQDLVAPVGHSLIDVVKERTAHRIRAFLDTLQQQQQQQPDVSS
jgi:hypothetical protein